MVAASMRSTPRISRRRAYGSRRAPLRQLALPQRCPSPLPVSTGAINNGDGASTTRLRPLKLNYENILTYGPPEGLSASVASPLSPVRTTAHLGPPWHAVVTPPVASWRLLVQVFAEVGLFRLSRRRTWIKSRRCVTRVQVGSADLGILDGQYSGRTLVWKASTDAALQGAKEQLA
uniref:Uncharacterized protein n=1 Tax=Leersia perrieri TaxID=77586 RepID=A0A0D9WB93_9ORYZ